MKRKLIKVGTSAAVIIPKAVLEEQGVKIGDTVHIELSHKAPVVSKKGLDPEVLEWTEKFRKRYQPLLKKLASS